MLKKLFKKVTGIQAIEDMKAQAEIEAVNAVKEAARAKAEAEEAKKEEELAKLTPKERATAQGMPYVTVLDTHVNKDNIRNGFFELDWNEYFVVQLKTAGYYGDTDEEIVDKWFQDLCRGIGAEEGVPMDRRGSGYINVNNLGNGKSEIS